MASQHTPHSEPDMDELLHLFKGLDVSEQQQQWISKLPNIVHLIQFTLEDYANIATFDYPSNELELLLVQETDSTRRLEIQHQITSRQNVSIWTLCTAHPQIASIWGTSKKVCRLQFFSIIFINLHIFCRAFLSIEDPQGCELKWTASRLVSKTGSN
jgi:hypothetical protein